MYFSFNNKSICITSYKKNQTFSKFSYDHIMKERRESVLSTYRHLKCLKNVVKLKTVQNCTKFQNGIGFLGQYFRNLEWFLFRSKPGLGQDYQVTQQANDQVVWSPSLQYIIHRRSLVGSKNASLLHFCTNPGIVDKNAPQNCCKINAILQTAF